MVDMRKLLEALKDIIRRDDSAKEIPQHEDGPMVEWYGSSDDWFLPKYEIQKIIAATEAELSTDPTSKSGIILAAKRLIVALNLPVGGGVAWDGEGGDDAGAWFWFGDQPSWFPENRAWVNYGWCAQLPGTALPPWPEAPETSWITLDTEVPK